jgi:hypothetical protein
MQWTLGQSLRGSGLVAQVRFQCAVAQMLAARRKTEHYGLYRDFFFHKRSHSYFLSLSARDAGSRNKSDRLDFLGDFRSYPTSYIVQNNILQIGARYLCVVPQTPK